MQTNSKEAIKRMDLDAILIAELNAAKNGDTESVISLSELIHKRLENIQYPDFTECADGRNVLNYEDIFGDSSELATKLKALISEKHTSAPNVTGNLVTEEKLSKIKMRLFCESDNVSGNDMIDIDDAFKIICQEIGVDSDEID